MLNYSLVDSRRIRHDPRKLIYLYPHIKAATYKDRTDEWYRNSCLRALEDVARISGCIVVPAACVHHKRRDPSRRVMLFGRTYYIRDANDMTDMELEKYQEYAKERDDDEKSIDYG